MKKRILSIFLALGMMIATSVSVNAETDYSYLDDMTINELKALDEEIHKRIPIQTSDTEETEIPEETEVLSYDDILKEAEKQDLETMMTKRYNNTVEAEQEYLGNIYTVVGVVSSIYDSYMHIEPIGRDIMGFFSVYFVNKEDYIGLEPGKVICVAGRIDNISPASLDMKNAYLIDNN